MYTSNFVKICIPMSTAVVKLLPNHYISVNGVSTDIKKSIFFIKYYRNNQKWLREYDGLSKQEVLKREGILCA